MKNFKKLFLFALMAFVIASLSACGDKEKPAEKEETKAEAKAEKSEKKNEEKGEEKNEEKSEEKAGGQSGEAAVEPDLLDIITLLKDNGIETGEPKPYTTEDIPGSTAAVVTEISGEEMLPLQIYKLDPASDNYKLAQDKSKVILEFEGQKGEIDILSKGPYAIFLAEGHPEREKVYKIIEEKLKP